MALTWLALWLLHELLQQRQTLSAKRSLLSMCGINSRASLYSTETQDVWTEVVCHFTSEHSVLKAPIASICW